MTTARRDLSARVAGELPGRLGVEVLVAEAGELLGELEPAVVGEALPGRGDLAGDAGGVLAQRGLGLGEGAVVDGGHAAVEVFRDEGQGAVQEVAHGLGQLGAGAADEPGQGKLAVLAEGHLAQEVVPQGRPSPPRRRCARGSVVPVDSRGPRPGVLLVFLPPESTYPWENTVFGRGRPALMRKAGQYTVWKRTMSLATSCTSGGQKRSASVPSTAER
jgi:hypothetical protein